MSEKDTFDSYLSDWFGLPFKFKSAILSFIQSNLTINSQSITGSIATVPTGGLIPYAGSAAPNVSWLICNGASVSRTTYAQLFAVIGTTYGSIDGASFNLPDVQGRMLVGVGTHADVALASTDGAALASRRPRHKHSTLVNPTITRTADVALSNGNHSHTVGSIQGVSPNAASGTTGFTGGDRADVVVSGSGFSNVTVGTQPTFSASAMSVGPQTGAEPDNAPSYLVVNYLIRT